MASFSSAQCGKSAGSVSVNVKVSVLSTAASSAVGTAIVPAGSPGPIVSDPARGPV